MIYCFDLDNTICSEVRDGNYELAEPFKDIVKEINSLYTKGNKIIIMTARGANSKIDSAQLTKKQLKEWGVKYNELICNKKPNADFFIDDKAINSAEWRKYLPIRHGIIAGCFDIIHPGYIEMFKDAKNKCNFLTIALHIDPSKERDYKLKPIHSVEERIYILKSISYIDNVITYNTEEDLINLLSNKKYDIRFLGTDYKNKNYTGKNLPIKIEWLNRNHHNYSSTRLKTFIYESVKEKKDLNINYD
jgi:glycerol-3-phosphate cytidylyltransferase